MEKLQQCLRALTLQQRQIFSAKLPSCKGNNKSINLIAQLLKQQKLEAKQRQPKSKNDRVHEYQIKTIKKTWCHPRLHPKPQ